MTASIVYWITALATFGATVTGVTKSFDLTTIPDKITRPMLPCFVPILGGIEDKGYKELTYMGTSPQIEYVVNHRLYCVESNSNQPISVQVTKCLNFLDAYNTAAKAQKLIRASDDPFDIPIAFTIHPGVSSWGDLECLTIDFRHMVKLYT